MNKNISKSIGAGIAGIATGVILSLLTDAILKGVGLLPGDNLWVGAPLVCFVLLYRGAYNVLGTYVAVRLSPGHSFKMAMVLGTIGTVVSVLGAIATADMNLGPAWYAWTLAIISLPTSLIGWRIYRAALR